MMLMDASCPSNSDVAVTNLSGSLDVSLFFMFEPPVTINFGTYNNTL
jgi:hypothetical protein